MPRDALQCPHFGERCCLSAGSLFLFPHDGQETITVFTKSPPYHTSITGCFENKSPLQTFHAYSFTVGRPAQFCNAFRKRDKARDGGVEPIAVATHRSLGTYSFLKLYVHFPCSCSRFLYWLVYPKSKSLKRIMPEAIEAVQQTSMHPDTQAEIEVFLDEHRKIDSAAALIRIQRARAPETLKKRTGLPPPHVSLISAGRQDRE